MKDLRSRDVDPECLDLCEAMNLYPGIRTIESCCGHGDKTYRIWFITSRLVDLPNLLYWFDGCHCGFYGWRCEVATDCGRSPVHFCIIGPKGEQAYQESKKIAECLRGDLKGQDDKGERGEAW